jgi:hypothetical protein
MQSKAKDVTTYIQEAPPEWQAALTRLRDLCRATLTGFEVSMDYGGPCYKRSGEGAIRYSKPRRIDFAVVESRLRGTVQSKGPIC